MGGTSGAGVGSGAGSGCGNGLEGVAAIADLPLRTQRRAARPGSCETGDQWPCFSFRQHFLLNRYRRWKPLTIEFISKI
jgi:hypothetical protein